MSTVQDGPAFANLAVDHVTFYVTDATARAAELRAQFGFAAVATSGSTGQDAEAYSIAVVGGDIRLVLTETRTEDHPATAYLQTHGEGVGDIALSTSDAAGAFAEAVARGARPVAQPAERDGIVTATIMGFGDVLHTFVQRPAGADPRTLPGFSAPGDRVDTDDAGLKAMDHFAVCLEAGQLGPTVEFYEKVLDFRMIFTEHIVVGTQAMNSEVVQSASGAVTLTLIEPDLTRDPGQIDEFVKNHGGAGVQHVAFTTADIVRSVGTLHDRGVEFLTTPATYYTLLRDRLELSRHSVDELSELNVLVDADHDGQLFQIFARSVHPRRTFFFEIIERAGAQTFGSGNIKALYEAVELQRDIDRVEN